MEDAVEERREPVHGSLTAAKRQGWRECRFLQEQKPAPPPTSSPSMLHTLNSLHMFKRGIAEIVFRL